MSGAAAFFDLDRTLLRRSSALALAGSFRDRGLIDRRQMAKAAAWQLLFVARGASHEAVRRAAEDGLMLLRGFTPEALRDLVATAMEPVLKIGAGDRSSGLGPQGQRAAAAVLERVHLLVHDVRACAGGSLEEGGVFEVRRQDRAVAVERAESLDLARHQAPERLLGGEDVVGASRRLEGRHETRRSARNGLRASSVPSVVGGPWPE